MRKIRYGLIVLSLLVCTATSATAQISIGIGLPNVSIGINLPLYPELVRVPGYPVYYAPRLNANYFFYDGLYWVYQDDYWYASSWYNGPWSIVSPDVVPLFILRIPVRYYLHPPAYFRGWQPNLPPRWGHHWGRDWERKRSGWNNWKRESAPRPAPLPVYQRRYTGDRYPRVEQQYEIHERQYRYQPRDKAVREHYKQRVEHRSSAPVQQGRPQEPAVRGPKHQETPRPAVQQPPVQQRGPSVHDQRQQQTPVQREQREMREMRDQREYQAPRVKEQGQRQLDRGESREPARGQGQRNDDDRGRGHGQRGDDERGQGRNK